MMIAAGIGTGCVPSWRELYEVAAAGRDTAQQQARDALDMLKTSNDTTVRVLAAVARYVAARDAYESETRRNWGPDKSLPHDHPVLREWIAARHGLDHLSITHAQYLKEFEK